MYEHRLQVQSETFPTFKLQHRRRIHQFFHLLIVDNDWKCHRLMRWLNPLSYKAVLNTVMVFLSFFYKKKHHRDTKAGCLLTWSWWQITLSSYYAAIYTPTVPSVLLTSAKFWLWTIFSTMSSASMRVSLTQLEWLSTESCFLLKHNDESIKGGNFLLECYTVLFFRVGLLCKSKAGWV